MNDIPEVALRTIEDIFGTRFVRHADGEAEPDAGQLFASVFPENAAQVESLTKLAARHRIPLIAWGAGTAQNSGRAPRALAVRFDAMREIRIPEWERTGWRSSRGSRGWFSRSGCAREV
jgi:FAD/FMN-containing dehydrogenase